MEDKVGIFRVIKGKSCDFDSVRQILEAHSVIFWSRNILL
jgi:hypothetical protein